MRLIVKQLWRAFPELDSYDDATCQRFVAATSRNPTRRAIRYVILGGLSLVALWLTAFTTAHVWDLCFKSNSWLSSVDSAIGLMAGAGVALVLLSGIVYFRDYLLIRRVRDVLRRHGSCSSCRYTLVGLPVPASGLVICPECGERKVVDASLGELTRDASGATIYSPNPAAAGHVSRGDFVRSLRHRKLVFRVVLLFGIVLVAVVIAIQLTPN